MRGDIETPWAGRAKEYSWSLCLRLAPRKITPTDIDYLVECNGKFAFFEMKKDGVQMPAGQARMFKALLRQLASDAVLFIVEHSPLDRIEVPTDITRFKCVRFGDSDLVESRALPGLRFASVYAAFFKWAEGDPKALREAINSVSEITPPGPRDHEEWLREYEANEKVT
jgi:hypothetical protein